MAARDTSVLKLPHGPLIIQCEGVQELEISPDFICMVSPVLADAVALMEQDQARLSTDDKMITGKKRALKVLELHDTTVEQWQIVMTQMYPAFEHPTLTLQEIRNIFPKYNISMLQYRINKRLDNDLFHDFSGDPKSDRYVLKWLQLADRCQHDKLKEACLKALKTPGFCVQAASGTIDADLKALGTDTLVQAVKSMAGPCHCCEANLCTCMKNKRLESFEPELHWCDMCKRHRVRCYNCHSWIVCG